MGAARCVGYTHAMSTKREAGSARSAMAYRIAGSLAFVGAILFFFNGLKEQEAALLLGGLFMLIGWCCFVAYANHLEVPRLDSSRRSAATR